MLSTIYSLVWERLFLSQLKLCIRFHYIFFLLFVNMTSNGENLAAVLYGINDLRLENRTIPVLKDDQVLLRMEVVGICGSDVHFLTRGRIGTFIVKSPMIIGHEASGTILQIGRNVKHLSVGDTVAIEPGTPCTKCSYCTSGKYNLCPDYIFCATPPHDGNLCQFYVHDANFCHKLPKGVNLEEGALLEPLSVGVHACKQGSVKFADACIILGAGPIGLVTLMAAKAMGATRILIADIVSERLNMANNVGADFTLLIDKQWNENEIIQAALRLLGKAPDVAFECTGTDICTRVGMRITRDGGNIVLIGLGAEEMKLPIFNTQTREVNIKGIFRYCNDYPVAMEMVRSGRVNIKPLITHRFNMKETAKAFQTAITGEGNPVKILIYPNAK